VISIEPTLCVIDATLSAVQPERLPFGMCVYPDTPRARRTPPAGRPPRPGDLDPAYGEALAARLARVVDRLAAEWCPRRDRSDGRHG
jgi:hypothetical protein